MASNEMLGLVISEDEEKKEIEPYLIDGKQQAGL